MALLNTEEAIFIGCVCGTLDFFVEVFFIGITSARSKTAATVATQRYVFK